MVNDWQRHLDKLRAEGRSEGIEQGLERGLEQGLEQGLRQGIALALEIKFGAAARDLVPHLEDLAEAQQLEARLEAVRHAARPEDLVGLLS